MAADPIFAAEALLSHIPAAARSLAAARADADHWRVGTQWAAVGVALILVRQSQLLPRLQKGLEAVQGRAALASLLCAVLFAALVDAAWTLGSVLADAVWMRGALADDLSNGALKLSAAALIGGLSLWALLVIGRRWPRFGWVGASFAATVLIFAAVLIPPVTLLPSARGDRPAGGSNTAPILAFVRNGGLDARMLYVFDSADPFAVDMEGVGPIAHAAVGRAALAAPQAEIYAAIGHLLGHHHHKDLWRLAALWSAVVTAFCGAVWTARRLLDRRADRAAPLPADNVQMLPVVGLVGWGLLLLATPTFNLFDQAINYRADDYALSLTHDPDALCRWLLTAEAGGKADPSPLEALFFYDHPPLKNRLINALRWKAAHA